MASVVMGEYVYLRFFAFVCVEQEGSAFLVCAVPKVVACHALNRESGCGSCRF